MIMRDESNTRQNICARTTHSLATVHVTFWSISHGTVYGLLHGMQHPWHAGYFQLGTSAHISAQPIRGSFDALR